MNGRNYPLNVERGMRPVYLYGLNKSITSKFQESYRLQRPLKRGCIGRNVMSIKTMLIWIVTLIIIIPLFKKPWRKFTMLAPGAMNFCTVYQRYGFFFSGHYFLTSDQEFQYLIRPFFFKRVSRQIIFLKFNL